MRLAFVIGALFPSGGLQRDCMAMARQLSAAGHEVTILTRSASAGLDIGAAKLELVDVSAWTNPGLDQALARRVVAETGRFDRIIGFVKAPGMDIHYSGDVPASFEKREWWRPFSPRGRLQQRLERACFGRESPTALIVLCQRQKRQYQSIWGTPDTRFRIIPPNVATDRQRPEARTDGTRERLRAELGVAPGQTLWLAVANYVRAKGVDRSIAALADFPGSRLTMAGAAPDSENGRWLTAIARQHGVSHQLDLLGIRRDIPELMAAADLFVHPARVENTGTVLAEAISNGVPIVTSAACGFAELVEQSGGGLAVAEPFAMEALVEALRFAEKPDSAAEFTRSALRYAVSHDLTAGHATAASLIVGPLWG